MKRIVFGISLMLTGCGTQLLIATPSPEEIKDLVLNESKNPQGPAAIPDKLEDDAPNAPRLGSVAKPLNYDVNKNRLPASHRLGRIVAERKLLADVPNKPGEIIVYSFIPTQGDAARSKKEFYIAFENVAHKAGTPFAKGTTLNVHLQYAGEKPQDWRTFMTLQIPTRKIQFKPAVVTIKPDAIVTIKNIRGKDDVFDLSKMKKIKS